MKLLLENWREYMKESSEKHEEEYVSLREIAPTESLRSPEQVEKYAEEIDDVDDLPPIFLEYDGSGTYKIVDGHHRYHIAAAKGFGTIRAVVADQMDLWNLMEKGLDRAEAFEKLTGWEYPLSHGEGI